MNDTPRSNTAAYNGHAYLLAEAREMERELEVLRRALKQARAWGRYRRGLLSRTIA